MTKLNLKNNSNQSFGQAVRKLRVFKYGCMTLINKSFLTLELRDQHSRKNFWNMNDTCNECLLVLLGSL